MIRAALIGAALGAALGAGCAKEGSLLVVDVTAGTPIVTDAISATIAAAGTTRAFSVPVAGGTLTTLFFDVELPPSATSVIVTLDAAGEEVTGSAEVTPGKVVTLALSFGDGAPDLGDASAIVDAGVACGNGKREGLEGCDDGNTDGGDGCSADCVVETDHVPTFTDIGSTGEASMTVASSRHIFIRRTGGCTSSNAPDELDHVALDGGVAPNFLSNVQSSCGGNIDSFGDLVVWGGTASGTLYVQRYNSGTSGLNAITWQSFAEPANWKAFAAESQAAGFYFSSASMPNKSVEVADPAGTGLLPFSSTPPSCGTLYFDHTTSTPTLLCASGTTVYRSDVSADAGSSFVSVANFMSMTLEPAAAVTDMTVDAEGTLYVAVAFGGNASAGGGVQAYNPTYSSKPVRFFDSSLAVRALAYDATANELVVLTGSALKRVSLNRGL